MDMNGATLPNERRPLDMRTPDRPSDSTERYLDSFASILQENAGAYVVVEFLIGTNNIVSKEGILYGTGNNSITIYNDVDNYYVVCDLYSVKFVNFFDTRYLRRRSDNEIANLSFERDGSLPIYYRTIQPGETPTPPMLAPVPLEGRTTAKGGPAPAGPGYPFRFRG